jgi:hypothetical protein
MTDVQQIVIKGTTALIISPMTALVVPLGFFAHGAIAGAGGGKTIGYCGYRWLVDRHYSPS